MTRPIRVHLVRTEWAHLGPHAGLKQYFRYLDRGAFEIYDRPTPFEDESVERPRRVRDYLRGLVRMQGMPWYTLGDLRSEFHAAIRMMGREVDIVHFFDPEHGMQYLPLLARSRSKKGRTGMIATFHQPPDLLPKILRPDVVSLLDHVTLVSPDQVQFFEACLPPERISVILHGVDVQYFRPPIHRPMAPTWTCLTVGHNLRDFSVVREVAERLRHTNVRFRLVTPQRTGVEDLPNVTVRGGLSDDELRQEYQTAGMLFLPLRSATANNALLEAFACGLPVVTTDLPATRSYAPGDQAILISDNDPAAYTEAILRLREDAALHSRLAVGGRRRAEELRWERIAPVYAGVYRAVAGSKEAGPSGRVRSS